MDERDFEGTIVLEKLAEIGKLDSFFQAIDNDDFDRVRKLMKSANIDSGTISIVLKKMHAAEE